MVRNVLAVYFAGQFINLLRKDFRHWKAYQYGIIDAKGNVQRKPETNREKKVWTRIHRLVAAVKQPLEKVAGGSTIASVYAGYKTFVEEYNLDEEIQASILDAEPRLASIHEAMVAGDSGGDPDKMASGENSGSVVGMGAGKYMKKRKDFKDWINLDNPKI